jgi:hypothetical protein
MIGTHAMQFEVPNWGMVFIWFWLWLVSQWQFNHQMGSINHERLNLIQKFSLGLWLEGVLPVFWEIWHLYAQIIHIIMLYLDMVYSPRLSPPKFELLYIHHTSKFQTGCVSSGRDWQNVISSYIYMYACIGMHNSLICLLTRGFQASNLKSPKGWDGWL